MCNNNSKFKIQNSKLLRNQDGQTLLELVIVISVSVIVIGALVFATIASLRNASFSKNQAQATKLAQEGIEKVRVGRDRNSTISISSTSVRSWNGSGSGDAIWDYHISGDCDRPDLASPSPCYFRMDPVSGGLTYIGGFAQASFPESSAESVQSFKRVIILSDDLNGNKIFTDDDWQYAKQVSVIVQWSDFSGKHESRLTTILRKI